MNLIPDGHIHHAGQLIQQTCNVVISSISNAHVPNVFNFPKDVMEMRIEGVHIKSFQTAFIKPSPPPHSSVWFSPPRVSKHGSRFCQLWLKSRITSLLKNAFVLCFPSRVTQKSCWHFFSLSFHLWICFLSDVNAFDALTKDTLVVKYFFFFSGYSVKGRNHPGKCHGWVQQDWIIGFGFLF